MNSCAEPISASRNYSLRTPFGFVPEDHPVRSLIDEALSTLDGLFDEIYSDVGKASVAPGRVDSRVPAASALHHPQRAAVGGTESRKMLYCWFVGLEVDDPVWHQSTLSKNGIACSTIPCCQHCLTRYWRWHANMNGCRRIISASMAH